MFSSKSATGGADLQRMKLCYITPVVGTEVGLWLVR
jgi:hypothetical protein